MEKRERQTTEVVAGLIFVDGQLLVCQRRAGGAFPLKWEFPGGKVERDENHFTAVNRELKEELDIEVQEAGLLTQYEYSYKDGPAVSLHFYRIKAFHGDVKNLVFQQISWVKLRDLETLDFLAGDRPLIEELVARGETALAEW